ncbi:hypothetical protein GCM10009077_41610 [Roseibium denhamense]|uniref:Uncharacterized protein n=1 Tax=Roseibium denhamense TaxID=76305 RepID=A0ABY1PLA3_9HYPH|nr:hypothetical protein SAMN06265374_4248 [Roseibium denhamense]
MMMALTDQRTGKNDGAMFEKAKILIPAPMDKIVADIGLSSPTNLINEYVDISVTANLRRNSVRIPLNEGGYIE